MKPSANIDRTPVPRRAGVALLALLAAMLSVQWRPSSRRRIVRRPTRCRPECDTAASMFRKIRSSSGPAMASAICRWMRLNSNGSLQSSGRRSFNASIGDNTGRPPNDEVFRAVYEAPVGWRYIEQRPGDTANPPLRTRAPRSCEWIRAGCRLNRLDGLRNRRQRRLGLQHRRRSPLAVPRPRPHGPATVGRRRGRKAGSSRRTVRNAAIRLVIGWPAGNRRGVGLRPATSSGGEQ